MKKMRFVLAGILTLTLCVSGPVWAAESAEDTGSEDQGLLESLLGEDSSAKGMLDNLFSEFGMLSGYASDEEGREEAINSIKDQLEDAGSELNQTISGILEMVENEDGSVDWDKVGDTVQEWLGAFSGSDTADADEEVEALMARYDALDEVMKEYVFARNAEFLEPGDVQIYSKQVAYMDDIDLDEVKVLAEFLQTNFTIEDDTLKMLCAAGDPLLLTLTKDEDGNFTVTDEKHAEDGENYTASVEAMCAEVGMTLEDYDGSMVFGKYNDADALADYLEEHPELKGGEFMGEIKTAEELREMSDAYTDELFDSIFGEE